LLCNPASAAERSPLSTTLYPAVTGSYDVLQRLDYSMQRIPSQLIKLFTQLHQSKTPEPIEFKLAWCVDAGAIRCRCLHRWIRRTLLRNSTSHLISMPLRVSVPLRHHRSLSDVSIFQPLADELFSSPLHDCGTLCKILTPVVPAQRNDCHFGHNNQPFYLLTYLVQKY